MDDAGFWKIIESGGARARSDPDRQLAAVVGKLTRLSPDEIRDFHRVFNDRLTAAYTWDLWGAGWLINGGCSDDGFHYFRAWLISRGRKVYEKAVENPDTLARYTDPDRDDYEFEDMWGAALDAYRAVTGEDMPPVKTRWPAKPRGRRWDFNDDEQVSRRLPALAKRYLG